jgi:hypothetical protein
MRPLCRDRGHIRVVFVYGHFRAAIEHAGKIHQNFRRASRALAGAVSNAVAILAEIRVRKRDMLHRFVLGWLSPNHIVREFRNVEVLDRPAA